MNFDWIFLKIGRFKNPFLKVDEFSRTHRSHADGTSDNNSASYIFGQNLFDPFDRAIFVVLEWNIGVCSDITCSFFLKSWPQIYTGIYDPWFCKHRDYCELDLKEKKSWKLLFHNSHGARWLKKQFFSIKTLTIHG